MDIKSQQPMQVQVGPVAADQEPKSRPLEIKRVEALDDGGAKLNAQRPPQQPVKIDLSRKRDAENRRNGGSEAQVKNNQAVTKEERQKSQQDALSSMIEELNTNLEDLAHTSVRFRIDREADDMVVKVIDTNTEEIVRQIPSEEMVDLMKRMKELQGLLFDKKA